MEISYDSKYNIAYVKLRPKTEEVEPIKISDELVIDMAPDGKVYGIELLNANEQLGLLSKKSFTFINEKDNKKTKVRIF
ncbi:hypothetical protein A2V82_09995 [candidate division KSB1 bacterium RBG_16_48_16]|nr:MAG: hypothetical protein A2V82_09995 [candidate division KSB1 bacterium RBG_16_48_16]